MPTGGRSRPRGDDASAGRRAPALRIDQVAISHPDAARLVEEVQGEYVARYGGRDDSPLDVSAFDPPGGAFFVGYLADQPVLTGGWRRRSDLTRLGRSRAAELKRMYVVPSARRLGLARLMLGHLEDTARDAGADLMVLETGTAQPEAITLYLASGYVPVAKFGYYKAEALSRCFAKIV